MIHGSFDLTAPSVSGSGEGTSGEGTNLHSSSDKSSEESEIGEITFDSAWRDG